MTRTQARATHWSMAFAVALVVAASAAARAAEIVHADGRREQVEELRRTGDGKWTYAKDGRRVVARPGEVALLVADDGTVTENIPELSDAPLTPQAEAALAQLRGAKDESWLAALPLLAENRGRALHDALVKMAGDRNKDVRLRAVRGLVGLKTKESLRAAAKAVVVEKDKTLRREASSALFAGEQILLRAGAEELLAKGLVDADRDVRLAFALLCASAMEETALTILRDEGIPHSDHHVREASALALGRAGDASGEKILAGMLRRSRVPGFDRDQEALMVENLIREQTEICRLFAEIGDEAAGAALAKAAKSPHEAVREAAAAAVVKRAARDAEGK